MQPSASSQTSAAPSAPTTPQLPPEPPPPAADLASEVPKFETELAADKVYAGIWDPARVDDLVVLLSGVSEMLADGGLTGDLRIELPKRKLKQAAIDLFVIQARINNFPQDFAVKLRAYLASIKSQPHLGVWAPPQSGQPPHDFAALALWMNRDQAAYVRELLAARQSGPLHWQSHDKPPVRPYLSTELGALQWLALLTTLTPDESARLSALQALAKQPRLGQAFKLGDFTYTVKNVTLYTAVGTGLAEKKASDGARFVVVDFTIRNDSNETATVLTDDFAIEDAQSRQFRPSADGNAALAMSGDKDLALSELQPGITKNMSTAFEMPEAAAKGIITLLIPEKGALGSTVVRITLK
ncbi:MAG: DUF4352 domain-containing protein [Polyangiaceae bacterium]